MIRKFLISICATSSGYLVMMNLKEQHFENCKYRLRMHCIYRDVVCWINHFYTGRQIYHHVLALKSTILLYDALPAVARKAGKSAV